MTMPRSAVKSIQVLPLLTSGAADAFSVSDDELALACSSHGAETEHVDAVSAWLTRIGCSVDDLECGPSRPLTPTAARALDAAGQHITRIHNCCSGKHSGFLTLAAHHGADSDWELPGYLAPSHPVQLAVRDAQAALTGVDLASQTPVVDGCGIPVFRFPLGSLAQAMARMVTPGAVPAPYQDAATRIAAVLPSRAFLVSGTGRAEQVLTDAATEPLIIKGGAEGVSLAALPDRGIGIALKAADGSLRGVDEAMAALLHHLGVVPNPITVHGPIRNAAGDAVGHFATPIPH